MGSLLGTSRGLYRSSDGRALLAGTPECVAACCGVRGFYRAFPCDPAPGCGGSPAGDPIYVPSNYRCAPDGTPPGSRTVIGFDRACWQVDTSQVYQLCPAGAPPATRYCIPDGARIIAPNTALGCLDSCVNSDCISSLPKWITLRPCRTGAWPPGEPLPVVRALGFEGGCIVGRDGNNDCWVADCASVFTAPDPPPGLSVLTGIDFAYRSCCECQCFGGLQALLGCDEQYPPPAQQPVHCCCPLTLNPGATLTVNVVDVRVGYDNCYHFVDTITWRGRWTIDEGGNVVGSGTQTVRRVYGGGPSCPGFGLCPPSGCVEEYETPLAPPSTSWCPPPLRDERPCPGTPSVTWQGARTCEGSWSRWEYTDPQPPEGPAFSATIRRTRTGRYTLSGVDYGPCTGGCGSSPLILADTARRPSAIGFEDLL